MSDDKENYSGQYRDYRAPKNMGHKLFVVLLLFLIFTTLWLSFYTVESGTVGVLSRFGKYQDEEVMPGMHFKIPFADTVKIFDIKLQTAHYAGSAEERGQEGVIKKPVITVLDKKNLNVSFDISVQFTPDRTQASEILQGYGRNYFEKLINPILRSVIRDAAGKYDAEDLAQSREAIGAEIRTLLDDKFDRLPMTLNEVSIRNVILPDVVKRKIIEVQEAKQEEQRLAMEVMQARQQQEKKTIEVNTHKIQVVTKAQASSEQKRIAADATAYAILKEAEAQAEAYKKINASLTPLLVQLKQVEAWDGTVPHFVAGEQGANFIMNMPRKAAE